MPHPTIRERGADGKVLNHDFDDLTCENGAVGIQYGDHRIGQRFGHYRRAALKLAYRYSTTFQSARLPCTYCAAIRFDSHSYFQGRHGHAIDPE